MEDTIAEKERLASLTIDLEGARCRLRASEILQTVQAQQPAGLQHDSLDALSLAPDAAGARGPGTYVLDKLDAYTCTALPPSGELTLVQFPLPYEPVPCKPLLFDVARNSVQLPDLSAHRKQERRGGLFGRLWGS